MASSETPKAAPFGSAFGAANKPKPTRGDDIEIPSPVARSPYGKSALRFEVAKAKRDTENVYFWSLSLSKIDIPQSEAAAR